MQCYAATTLELLVSYLSTSVYTFTSFESSSFTPQTVSYPLTQPTGGPTTTPDTTTVADGVAAGAKLSGVHSVMSHHRRRVGPHVRVRSRSQPRTARPYAVLGSTRHRVRRPGAGKRCKVQSIFNNHISYNHVRHRLNIITTISGLKHAPNSSTTSKQQVYQPVPRGQQ